MRVIIDRFEGKFAVCETEDKAMINIEISRLPLGCKEGDVLGLENGKIIIDNISTSERQKHIEKITKGLWEN
jgi:hypothetical protein